MRIGGTTPSRRRWVLLSVGAAALASSGSLWLAGPGEGPGEAAVGAAIMEPGVASAIVEATVPDEATAGSGREVAVQALRPELEGDLAAKLVAVRSWAPSHGPETLIFVCSGSIVEGRRVALRRQANGAAVTGLAVAAPEWTGPCEESDAEALRAGLPVRVVLSPRDYAVIMGGDRGWDVGPLRIGPEEAVAMPGPAGDAAVAAR